MKLCPTCGRKPSERIGVDREMVNECGYDIEARYPTAPCPDPLHDAADRVGEIVEENEARVFVVSELVKFVRGLSTLSGHRIGDDACAAMVKIADTAEQRSALPEVPR